MTVIVPAIITADATALRLPRQEQSDVDSASDGEMGLIARAPRVPKATISQFGITWTFDSAAETGQFANGDWWVRGPVNIIGISPSSKASGGRTMNGSMINPAVNQYHQGYDSAMYGGLVTDYQASLNAALDVSPTKVLRLQPGSSLVSTISVTQAQALPQTQTAAILTCVASAPPAGSFRPPYVAGTKEIRFNKSQLDYSQLATLTPVASTPSLANVERTFQRPWLDHVPGWLARFTHPLDNMPDYGRDLASEIGVGALMLHLNFTNAQKTTLLVEYVQLGIDLYGIVEAGGDNWSPDGGHASGRKWPIIFAGQVLKYAPMTRVGIDRPSVQFGEDGQTFYVQQTSPGVYNYGYGGYTAQDVGMPEWGFQHINEPQRDNKSWTADPYRGCCTANAWSGFLLAARIMHKQADWNHDALFAYMDRYLQVEQTPWMRFWDAGFTANMWQTYRPSF